MTPDSMVTLRKELKAEFASDDFVSLQIWRMFNNKNGLLPNNRRILNMSWRIYSMDCIKKHQRAKSRRNSKGIRRRTTASNLNLLKQHSSETLIDKSKEQQPDKYERSAEFDYIDHIRRLSNEDYTPSNSDMELTSYNDLASYNNEPISYDGMFAQSNPIDIDYNRNSFSSDSVFSQRPSFNSVSSVSPAPSFRRQSSSYQKSVNGTLFSKLQKYRMQLHQSCAKRGDEYETLGDTSTSNNFKEFLDMSKFDDGSSTNQPAPAIQPSLLSSHDNSNKFKVSLRSQHRQSSTSGSQPLTQSIQPMQQPSIPHWRQRSGSSSEMDNEYSLDSYISMLESSLDQHEKKRFQPQTYPTPTTVSSPLQPSSINSTALPGSSLISRSSSFANSSPSHPVCENCLTSTTPLWRKTSDNRLLCNACGLFFKLHGVIRPPGPAQKPKHRYQDPETILNMKEATQHRAPTSLEANNDMPNSLDGDMAGEEWNWLRFE